MKIIIIIILITLLLIAGLLTVSRTALINDYLHSPEVQEYIRILVVKAEQIIIGDAKGKERLAWVLGQMYPHLPEYITDIITVDDCVSAINYIFNRLSVKLDNGHTVAMERNYYYGY